MNVFVLTPKERERLTTYWGHDNPSWKKLSNENAFLEYVLPHHVLTSPDTLPLRAESKALPFYEDVDLVRVNNTDPNPVDNINQATPYNYYAKIGKKIIQIFPHANFIYELHEHVSPLINLETAADYLKFFCLFVDWPPFYIIESKVSEFLVPQSPLVRDRTLENFLPIESSNGEEEGTFVVKARVVHQNSAYDCKFLISRDGMVEMLEDYLVRRLFL